MLITKQNKKIIGSLFGITVFSVIMGRVFYDPSLAIVDHSSVHARISYDACNHEDDSKFQWDQCHVVVTTVRAGFNDDHPPLANVSTQKLADRTKVEEFYQGVHKDSMGFSTVIITPDPDHPQTVSWPGHRPYPVRLFVPPKAIMEVIYTTLDHGNTWQAKIEMVTQGDVFADNENEMPSLVHKK